MKTYIHFNVIIMVKAFILSAILFVLVFCNREREKYYTFNPDNLQNENEIKLDQIGDGIQYIPLDNKFQIGIIYAYYFINNSIYLSAKDIGIVEFNRDGKTIQKYGNIGRGPGEYIFPMIFTVDGKNGTVYVNDIGGKIQVYSKNGSYLRTINTKEKKGSTEAIYFFSSKLILFNSLSFSDADKNWVIIDTLGHVIGGKERTVPMFQSNWMPHSGLYLFNNNLCYWNPYNDTIFKIKPDLKSEPALLIAQGDYRLPKSDFNSQNLKRYMHLSNCFETERFYVVSYFYNNKYNLVLIEKQNNKYYLSVGKGENDNPSILNNLDDGLGFSPKRYFKADGIEYMVDIVTPNNLIAHVNSDSFRNSIPKFPDKKDDLEKITNKLKQTDNPILVLVRLKK